MKENVAVPSSSISPSSVPISVAPSGALGNTKVRRAWPLYAGLGVAAIVVMAGGLASGAYSKWASGDSIAPGVAIAGVPVGGFTKSEAQSELEKRFGRLFVSLDTADRPFKLSLAELGGQPAIAATVQKAYQVGRDGGAIANFFRVYGSKAAGERFMLPVMWRKPALVAKLTTVNKIYGTPATSARIKVGEDGVEIVPEVLGKGLNIGETALQIQKKYFVGAKEMEAATREVEPKIKSADLEGTDVELGHYTTRFNPGQVGRTTNMRVACRIMDGHVLMPGESFSFNAMTGERTYDKGYRMAKIYERMPGEIESEVVDGLAGGVCQVSTTIFNAVRKTNAQFDSKHIKILERSTHSLPVHYAPKGLDATVAWPSKDLRFRNDFKHPIYIRTVISGSHLTVGVWGRVSDEKAAEMEKSDAGNSESSE